MVKKVSTFAGDEYLQVYNYATAYVPSHKDWWSLHEFKNVVPEFKIRPNGYEGYQ